MAVDPVSLSMLVASSGVLAQTLYRVVRFRRNKEQNVKIEIKQDGKTIVVSARDLDKPEQAELFIREFLAREDGDQGGQSDD